MITVVVSYVAGTKRLMETYLASMARHDAGVKYDLHVYADREGEREAKESFDCKIIGVDVPDGGNGSQRHAFILDEAMKKEEGLVLTMDSDMLPINPYWLNDLYSMHRMGVSLPGVRWPWGPQPDLDPNSIDGRVMSYQNWDNTWVACQLVEVDFIREHNLSYQEGEDTGFALLDKVNELGLPMGGWNPRSCARAQRASAFDNEFNRMMFVEYGGLIVHIGGGSGQMVGRTVDRSGLYGHAMARTFKERGAEWIQNPDDRHHYLFDREDEVVEFKMRGMREEMVKHLQTHDALFSTPKN